MLKYLDQYSRLNKCIYSKCLKLKLNVLHSKNKGFTIIELMISIAILGIITAIAMPSLTTFIVAMRVDNEISQLHRLILTARNTAISMSQNVTLCPLNSSNACSNDWDKELSVFIDLNGNSIYESATNETLIKVKQPANSDDTLTYTGFSRITFAPTGQLSSALNSIFKYCPNGYADLSRAVVVSRSGRSYQSSDLDGDGKDEIRGGAEVVCN